MFAVRFGIAKYLASDDNPQITEKELTDRFSMSDLMLRKIFLLLQASDIFGGSIYREDIPGEHPVWTVTAAPTIRRYRKVTTIEQYLAVRQSLRERHQRPTVDPAALLSGAYELPALANPHPAQDSGTQPDVQTPPVASHSDRQDSDPDGTTQRQYWDTEGERRALLGLSREARAVLEYVVRNHEPEDLVQREVVAQAVGLDGRNLTDTLSELGDAGLIKGFGNAAHRYAAFQVLPLAWEQVDASIAGFDVEQDMVQVAAAVNQHEQVERATLLQEMGFSEKRLDVAALILKAHDHIILIRPGVRGLTFATAIATHKTRLFLKSKQGANRRVVPPAIAQPTAIPTTSAQLATVRVLRVVVASPSDVQKERASLRTVLDELNDGLARQLGLHLELWGWENGAFPGLHEAGPQGQIDRSMRIEEAHIVIGVFWKRFGTPVADAQSGTEHELRRAYEAWQKNSRPQVMVYFKEQAYRPKDEHEFEQMRAVFDFQQRFPKEGLWWPYRNSRQFPDLVRGHLQKFLLDRYSDSGSAEQ